MEHDVKQIWFIVWFVMCVVWSQYGLIWNIYWSSLSYTSIYLQVNPVDNLLEYHLTLRGVIPL